MKKNLQAERSIAFTFYFCFWNLRAREIDATKEKASYKDNKIGEHINI